MVCVFRVAAFSCPSRSAEEERSDMKYQEVKEVSKMSEEKIAGIMREFVQALARKDVEKALSYFADDASWRTNEGTFNGKSEIRNYLTWMSKMVSDQKITEAGIGCLVKGNTAVYESDQEGTYEGTKYGMRVICIHEFKGEKFQNVRTIYDRLSIAKQAAKGWLAESAVNSIVNRMEKGLH
jgi:ketosteroid isomerase-like protein